MIEKQYEIVTNILSLHKLIDHINSSGYLAFDTETTGLNTRKDTVIGLSVSGKAGVGFYLPRMTWNCEANQLQQVCSEADFIHVLKLLEKKDLLMWNGSFDIRMVKSNFDIDLRWALLAEVMLMKHTVSEEGDFALKKVAISLQEELGLNVEEEANKEQIELKANIAKNGGSTTKTNYEMYKADLEVMGMYAAADADLTLRLGEYFQKKLEEENLDSFFYDKEVMPLYKWVTITMEEKGVKLDLPLIHQVREGIVRDMANLELKIRTQILSTEEGRAWRLAKALEFYPASNKGKFATVLCNKFSIPLAMTEKGSYSFTKAAIAKLPESDVKAFLQGTGTLDLELLESVSLELFDTHDGLNINSKDQLGKIVFDFMGIKPLSKTDAGKPQFDDDMIQVLIKEHEFEWARDLSNYNKLVKILGTYIDRFLEAQEDGVFYPSFYQHRTVSGRYGSDLQQLPRPKEDGELDEIILKYVNLIKTFFISGDGRIFIDDDYESLEPHVFAHVSGDERLRDVFRKGHDFYSTIAIATEKLEGYSADKKAENYLGKLNKPLRQKSKAFSLGIPYGMSGYALGKTLEISTEEAEALVEGYLSGFPDLRNWMQESELHAKAFGWVKSEAGRVRHLPKVKELYEKHKGNLLDFKYRQRLEWKLVNNGTPKFEAKKKVNEAYKDYKNGLNNAKNVQIQSLGASIVNMAAIEINKRFVNVGMDAWVALQIHDELVINAPEDRAQEAADIVQEVMENNYKLSIKLKAIPQISKNLRDGH
jgi:DNA polymerase I-like protein with 3'-5' exonuclease and polymerase domains